MFMFISTVLTSFSPLFVTLNKKNRLGDLELRGCIGNLGPIPLSKLYDYALNRYLVRVECL